jgi:hypothetical protein
MGVCIMATKPRTKPAKSQVATAVQAAHAVLLPILCTLQDVTQANVLAGESRSKQVCAALIALYDNSTNRAADGIALLGDGKKGTKKDDGVKGSIVDALVKQYGDKLHVNVRSEVSKMRIVYAELHNPLVRKAAEENGLRAARNIAKPKAAAETEVAVATKPAGTVVDRAVAILSEDGGFDAMLTALRSHFVRAADSIGLSKMSEIEVHLMSKTKKTG